MQQTNSKPIQGSLFEENFLLRTLGSIADNPDMALTELVANAWDAGASFVKITIPDDYDGELIVQDDGCGMTPDQFRKRWMTLGYDRPRHQGHIAEFPQSRKQWRRRAYGRDGVGRHSLLCFDDKYQVQTRRDGIFSTFVVTTTIGEDPFVLLEKNVEVEKDEGHGTRLIVSVKRHLSDPERIGNVLSGRFLSDPQFKIYVNGSSVPLTKHEGLIDKSEIQITDNLKVEVLFFKVDDTSKRVLHHGIAFWVSGRLVGESTWTLGDRIILDGRTRLAKRHTIVVRGEALFDLVLQDWGAFKQSPLTETLFSKVADYVEEKIREIAGGQIQQTKEEVLRRHRTDIKKLKPLARLELTDMVNHITTHHPTLSQEYVSIAVEAAIQIEKTRSGAELLEKLSKLSDEDVEGLNRLLSEWTVRDALTVLDEIDHRIAVIEALEKLSGDRKVDELHTLHPLVTQARWLFGPEFDSPEYSSNVSLINAVKIVFKKRLSADAFKNSRKRPDLVMLKDASLSVTATEGFEPGGELIRMQSVLIIELKKGASTISRKEMNQASDYVEDILSSGAIEGTPFVHSFVVGHRLDEKTQPIKKIGEPDIGRIEACTYSQMIRTAGRRLFNLRERLHDRYYNEEQDSLLQRILSEPQQMPLLA